MSFKEQEYREIITKAICGKGKERFTCTETIEPVHDVTSVLGCWIINHSYEANKKNEHTVEITGSYDVNIWYAHDDNTKTEVLSKTIHYCDAISLQEKDRHCLRETEEVIAKVLRQPNCLDCKRCEKGEGIIVTVEREFLVQVIGETKVSVRVENDQKHHAHRK